MTLAVTGGTVVISLDPPQVVVGDVIVDGASILWVDPAPQGGTAVDERLDATGCLVIPGNVCAHTHVYSALARGMPYHLPPPTDFLEVLQRIWWRLDRALDPETIRASALVGAMEAVLCGTTTLVDHHASPDAIDGSLDIVAEAFATVGVRSVLCYETSDRDGPERARAGIEENRRFAARVSRGTLHPRDPDLVRAMIGAHASFTLSDATLEACAAAAHEAGVGVHLHVAEDAVDEQDSEARHGARVVPRLARAGILAHDALLAHGVHLDAAEAALVRASGATVAHNPRSNMNNAVGRTPLALLGERVALGTDGIGGDLFEEARVAWLRHREEDRAIGPDWAMTRLAQSSALAGRAFDEPDMGRLVPGAPADLVVIEAAAPTPVDASTLAGHWGFGLSARQVRDVVAGGRVVVADRRLVRADGERIAALGREAAVRLWRRLEDLPAPHPFTPEGAMP